MAPAVLPLRTGRLFSTQGPLNVWRNGKQMRLWRTPKGAYFRTDPQGEGHYTFTLLTFAAALRLYQVDLPDVLQLEPFDQAFPGYEVEEG